MLQLIRRNHPPPCFDAYNFDFDSSRSFAELSQVFYLVRFIKGPVCYREEKEERKKKKLTLQQMLLITIASSYVTTTKWLSNKRWWYVPSGWNKNSLSLFLFDKNNVFDLDLPWSIRYAIRLTRVSRLSIMLERERERKCLVFRSAILQN